MSIKEIGEAASAVLLALATLLGSLRLWRGTTRAEPDEPAAGQHVDVPTSGGGTHRVDVSGLPSQMASAITTLSATVAQQVEQIAQLRSHSVMQDEEMRRMRDDLASARAAVVDVHDWLDDGMPDPPGRPSRPEWARPTY